MDVPTKRAAEANTSRRVGSVGSWSSLGLYEDALDYKGKRYHLTREVRASVSQTGNTSTSQGWVAKTQHDNREVRILVEGPDVYLDVRAAKGQTPASDLSAAMTNFAFRQQAEQARKFATKINNAASGSDKVRAARRSAVEVASLEANAAFRDVEAIVTFIEKQTSVAELQRAVAAADLAALEALEVPGVFRRGGLRHRNLVNRLQRELAEYAVEAFERGLSPAIWMPPAPSAPAAPSRPSSAASVPSKPNTAAVLVNIKQLADLRAAGVLTEAEFVAKKAELLSRI